ncbi:MAG TPA: TolC family protein, partial [Longimicrobiales bacterium]
MAMSLAMRKTAAACGGRAGSVAGRALVVVLVAALVPTARPAWLRAQTVDPFAGLVAEALRNNLALEQARLAEARAAAAVREARGRLLPSLALDYRYTEQDGTLNFGDLVNPVFGALNELSGANRFPTDIDLTIPFRNDARLRLVQPLYDPRLWASRALAGHRRDAAHYARRAAARRLAAEVQAAYLGVAAARSAARIYEAGLALVRENERVAGRLVEAGRATPDVVYRARAERGEVEQQLLGARERVHAAERRFNRLMGRGVDAPVEEIPDSLLRFEVSLTEEEAIAHALAHREELFGAASQSAAAEA